MKDRQYNIDAKRKWICPNCEHEEERHHSSNTRPFCDACDWQNATLIEMEPYKNGEIVSI